MKRALEIALVLSCICALTTTAPAQTEDTGVPAAAAQVTAAYAGTFGDSTRVTIVNFTIAMAPGQPGKPVWDDGQGSSSLTSKPAPTLAPFHAWLADGESLASSGIVVDQGELQRSGDDLYFHVSGASAFAASERVHLFLARPDWLAAEGPMVLVPR